MFASLFQASRFGLKVIEGKWLSESVSENSPMTVRADAEEKETALLKSRLATPRSPQVVYDTDEEESDNNRGTNSSDQMEDSGDELDRAHEVNLVCYFSH